MPAIAPAAPAAFGQMGCGKPGGVDVMDPTHFGHHTSLCGRLWASVHWLDADTHYWVNSSEVTIRAKKGFGKCADTLLSGFSEAEPENRRGTSGSTTRGDICAGAERRWAGGDSRNGPLLLMPRHWQPYAAFGGDVVNDEPQII